MSWFDTLQNVADVAFKTPKGEPTKADEDEEKAKLASTVVKVPPSTPVAPKPVSKQPAKDNTPGDTGSWIDAGTDILGSVSKLVSGVPNSLIEQAEEVASTGLANIHGDVGVSGGVTAGVDVDVSGNVTTSSNVDVSGNPTLTLGLSQETMLLVAGITLFTGIEIFYFMSRR